MKNKRSKSSIFYDSTKKKHRKQEQSEYSKKFYARKPIYLEKNEKPDQKGYHFHYRNPTSVGTFFIDDESFSRPDHTYKKDEPQKTYVYGFTDSKFLYFLAMLKPKEYLLFVTIVALLIIEGLNETESKIVFAFISNVADTMQTMVEQEVILNQYKSTTATRQLNNALHQDFETIYAELAKIKKKLPK